MLLPLLLFQPNPLDTILDDAKLKGAVVSACVAKADGTILYRRNEGTRVMPASNQKLLTVAFAVHKLGADYRPVTRIWKLDDRIVVDSPGDPSLAYARLKEASSKLGAAVRLPVFVRQAYRCLIPPTWETDDLPFTYAGRVAAFSFDRGQFKVFAEKGSVFTEPAEAQVRVLNLPFETGQVRYDPERNLLTVYGSIPEKRTELGAFASPEPDALAARVLGGPLLTATSVPKEPPTVTITGDTMAELARACLPPSDNTIAENLLLMACGKSLGDPEDPYPAANKQLQAFLESAVGIEKGDVRPVDGSGMSRHNLATTRAIVKLLAWAGAQPFADVWRKSLATPGTGTLKSRLAGIEFRGKTGTLDSASSLSGYVTLKSGEVRIVSLVFNHYLCTGSEAREIQDRLIQELAREGSIGTHVEWLPQHEVARSGQVTGRSNGNRVPRPLADRRPLSKGAHRRAEPSDAAAAGTKPLAVLAR